MQLEPIKPVLKAPGSMLLKLRYDGPVSNFGLNFNLRGYSQVSLLRWFQDFYDDDPHEVGPG